VRPPSQKQTNKQKKNIEKLTLVRKGRDRIKHKMHFDTSNKYNQKLQ
jgi:hypothetical protein